MQFQNKSMKRSEEAVYLVFMAMESSTLHLL